MAKISPLQLIETTPGNFSLMLTEFDEWAETFEEMGQEGGGYGWHGAADALVRLKAAEAQEEVRL